MKRCSLCRKNKDLSEFDPEEYHYGGACRECKRGSKYFNRGMMIMASTLLVGIVILLTKVAIR